MDASTAHVVLGVGATIDPGELRRAYRQALLRAHPDHGGTRQQLEAVRQAFELLHGAAPASSDPAPAPARRRPSTRDLVAGRYQTAPACTVGSERRRRPPPRQEPDTSFASLLAQALRRTLASA